MQNRLLPAIASLCLGVLVFSLQDLILKGLSGTYPVTQAMTIRSVVALPILLALVGATRGLSALRSGRLGLLALRAIVSFGAYMTYYLALAAIPLADAVAIFFAAPLLISLLAVLVLGERIRLETLAALVLGLVGVLVTLRPGAGVFEWASLLTLLSASLYAGAQVMARKLSASEDAAVITFFQNAAFLIGAPLMALAFRLAGPIQAEHASLAFLTRPWVWPTTIDLLLMGACGVIAAAGMTLLSQGYRLAPAAKVSVFEYSAILWAPLWGFLFFQEVPKLTTLGGAALIALAGLLALRKGR
jgi:drug/metabolite transporter (DMT)-like permease